MSAKDKFTAEEWKTLLQAPMLVGFAVVGADPSGPVGFVKEMSAVAGSLLEGSENAPADSLLGALATEIKADPKIMLIDEKERPSINQAKDKAVEICGKAVQLLNSKASPEDAAAYKQWLVNMAKKVAEASKEGGFLGFGGVRVSEGEAAAVADISKALGLTS